jgi:hypothetical protein
MNCYAKRGASLQNGMGWAMTQMLHRAQSPKFKGMVQNRKGVMRADLLTIVPFCIVQKVISNLKIKIILLAIKV